MKNAQSKFAQTLGSVYQSRHRVLLTGKISLFVLIITSKDIIWPVQTRYEHSLSEWDIFDLYLFSSLLLPLFLSTKHTHSLTLLRTQALTLMHYHKFLPQALLCRTIYQSSGRYWTFCFPLSSHPLTHLTSGLTSRSLLLGTSLTQPQVQLEYVSVYLYACACVVRVCGVYVALILCTLISSRVMWC